MQGKLDSLRFYEQLQCNTKMQPQEHIQIHTPQSFISYFPSKPGSLILKGD